MRLVLGLALVLTLPYTLPWLAETAGPVLGSLVVPDAPTPQVPEQP